MKEVTKKVKRVAKASAKSKTMMFSVLLSAFGVLQTQTEHLKVIISDPQFFSLFCVFISVVVAGLRVVTTESLMDKSSDKESSEN